MLRIQTEPIAPHQVMHIVDADNAELASEVLEAALRRDLYIETDSANVRRICIFFITQAQLDEVLTEARNNWLTSLKRAA